MKVRRFIGTGAIVGLSESGTCPKNANSGEILSKRIAIGGLLVLAMLGLLWFLWPSPNPAQRHAQVEELVLEEEPTEVSKRRLRKREHKRVLRATEPAQRLPNPAEESPEDPEERSDIQLNISSMAVQELIQEGEKAFGDNDSERAYAYYLEVVEEHPESEAALFALYKLAWVEYNLGEYDEAVADMKMMIEWSEDAENFPFADEAVLDLKRFERAVSEASEEGP